MPLKVVTDLWLPLAVAAIVSTIPWFMPKRRDPSPSVEPIRSFHLHGVVIAIAMAIALIALHVMNFGKPVWPPPSLTERLLPAFAAAGLAGMLASLSPRPVWARGLSFAGTLGVLVIVLWPMIATPAGAGLKSVLLIVVTVALLATLSASSLAGLDHRGHPVAAAVILAGCGWAGGVGLLGSGNMMLGQFGFAVGAAGLGILLAIIPISRIRAAPKLGMATTAFALLAGLLLAGNQYGELRPVPALLFALPAPLSALTVRLISRTKRPRLIGIVAIVIAALSAGLAAGLSIDLTGHSTSSYPEEEE